MNEYTRLIEIRNPDSIFFMLQCHYNPGESYSPEEGLEVHGVYLKVRFPSGREESVKSITITRIESTSQGFVEVKMPAFKYEVHGIDIEIPLTKVEIDMNSFC